MQVRIVSERDYGESDELIALAARQDTIIIADGEQVIIYWCELLFADGSTALYAGTRETFKTYLAEDGLEVAQTGE